jgi:ubiquinol-cytochrome c reductase cytochrome c subunit
MKNSGRLVLVLLSVGLCGLVAAQAQQTNAPAAAGNAQNGKTLFLKNGCYECHGTVGQGGTGPRLAPNPLPADRLIAYVRKPMGMPPYSATVMSDTELADVRAYLASIPPPPPLNSIPLLNDK